MSDLNIRPTNLIDTYTCKFLFSFFTQIYILEILMQIYVLFYSISKYDNEEELYRIIYLDIVLALLMSIELKSNYDSILWVQFITNISIQIDIAIAFVSIIFIFIFILHKENLIDFPEESTEMFHIIRDITRGLRIHVFARNLYKLLNDKVDLTN